MSEICYGKKTVGEMNIHSVSWVVKLTKDTNKILYAESTNFLCLTDPDFLRIRLRAQLLGRENDVIEFYYLLYSTVFCKMKLIYGTNYDGKIRIIEKDFHTVQGNKWHYLDTVISQKFYFPCGRELKLEFEFCILNGTGIEEDPSKVRLHNDLGILLVNGNFCDVTLKSDDGKEYKAHKAMLASRSAVLKSYFELNPIECQIETPFESEVLAEVLTFIYTDQSPKVDDMSKNLLAAADYYQLSGLKSLCEVALHKELTVENALGILQLAQLYSAKTLTQLTLDFIKDGQAVHIIKTDAWAKLDSVELMKSIVEHIVNDVHNKNASENMAIEKKETPNTEKRVGIIFISK